MVGIVVNQSIFDFFKRKLIIEIWLIVVMLEGEVIVDRVCNFDIYIYNLYFYLKFNF